MDVMTKEIWDLRSIKGSEQNVNVVVNDQRQESVATDAEEQRIVNEVQCCQITAMITATPVFIVAPW